MWQRTYDTSRKKAGEQGKTKDLRLLLMQNTNERRCLSKQNATQKKGGRGLRERGDKGRESLHVHEGYRAKEKRWLRGEEPKKERSTKRKREEVLLRAIMLLSAERTC